jgi:hypothetical protein
MVKALEELEWEIAGNCRPGGLVAPVEGNGVVLAQAEGGESARRERAEPGEQIEPNPLDEADVEDNPGSTSWSVQQRSRFLEGGVVPGAWDEVDQLVEELISERAPGGDPASSVAGLGMHRLEPIRTDGMETPGCVCRCNARFVRKLHWVRQCECTRCGFLRGTGRSSVSKERRPKLGLLGKIPAGCAWTVEAMTQGHEEETLRILREGAPEEAQGRR